MSGVVDNRDGVCYNLVVLLPAGLSVKGEGYLLAAGLPDDDLLLINCVGGIGELGNIGALVLDLVLALDLRDGDVLGDTDLLGGSVGKAALDNEGSNDKGNLVGLGLILLMADLVLTTIEVGTVVVGRVLHSTSGDLHGLRLLVIGDLGGLAVSDNILLLVDIGADLFLDNSVGLLADVEDTVEAVVVVSTSLTAKVIGVHLLGKGRHVDLRVTDVLVSRHRSSGAWWTAWETAWWQVQPGQRKCNKKSTAG